MVLPREEGEARQGMDGQGEEVEEGGRVKITDGVLLCFEWGGWVGEWVGGWVGGHTVPGGANTPGEIQLHMSSKRMAAVHRPSIRSNRVSCSSAAAAKGLSFLLVKGRWLGGVKSILPLLCECGVGGLGEKGRGRCAAAAAGW